MDNMDKDKYDAGEDQYNAYRLANQMRVVLYALIQKHANNDEILFFAAVEIAQCCILQHVNVDNWKK